MVVYVVLRFFCASIDQREFLEPCGPIPFLRVQCRKRRPGCVVTLLLHLFDPIGIKRDPTNLTINPIRLHFALLQGTRNLQRILLRNAAEVVSKGIPQGIVGDPEHDLFALINLRA